MFFGVGALGAIGGVFLALALCGLSWWWRDVKSSVAEYVRELQHEKNDILRERYRQEQSLRSELLCHIPMEKARRDGVNVWAYFNDYRIEYKYKLDPKTPTADLLAEAEALGIDYTKPDTLTIGQIHRVEQINKELAKLGEL